MKSENSKFSVVISTQDPLTRLGMKQIALMCVPACDVYSDFDSMSTALFTVLDVSVNLLITDMYDSLNTQGKNGGLLLALCHHHPQLNVIIYAQYVTPEMHALLQHCPRVSFLSRKSPIREACQVFATALGGERYYNPAIIPKRQNIANGVGALTISEKRVLSFLLKGYSQNQIAGLLCRSIKTINTQKCSTIRKLGFKSNSELFLVKDLLLNSLQ